GVASVGPGGAEGPAATAKASAGEGELAPGNVKPHAVTSSGPPAKQGPPSAPPDLRARTWLVSQQPEKPADQPKPSPPPADPPPPPRAPPAPGAPPRGGLGPPPPFPAGGAAGPGVPGGAFPAPPRRGPRPGGRPGR